jgi:hypothetical protein
MIRLLTIVLAAAAVAGCGDNITAPLTYKDPPKGGLLRLVKDGKATGEKMLLDLVVGDQQLVGYATGFDLPLDATKVTLAAFAPGTALDPGGAPQAAGAGMPADGPLASMLVVALSQKAAGAGAVPTDATLAPGAVLLQIELDRAEPITPGLVFDGLDSNFHLPSGGLRDRSGMTVVDETQVSIGRLEIAK